MYVPLEKHQKGAKWKLNISVCNQPLASHPARISYALLQIILFLQVIVPLLFTTVNRILLEDRLFKFLQLGIIVLVVMNMLTLSLNSTPSKLLFLILVNHTYKTAEKPTVVTTDVPSHGNHRLSRLRNNGRDRWI